MNNTSFLPSQSIFSNGQITGNSWGTPNNIFLVDGDFATSNVNAGSASDFIIGNFNFNLPQNAVPTGIEIEIIGLRGAQTSPPISLEVSFYDNTNGVDNFYPYTAPITSLTPTISTVVIGGSTYLFNSAFTVDQINNMKLALTANGDISLDSVLVKVYYFIQTPPVPPPIIPGVCVDCSSPIQVQAMYLELPFLIGQTKFYLKKGSFSYPNGIPVQPGDIGSCGGTIPFVFDESKRKMDGQNFEENAMLDTNIGGTWTVLNSGVIEVDLISVTQRGLDYKTPAAHIAANMSDHDANSKVIISNNEPYNLQLIRSCQVDTVFSAPIIVENQDTPLADSAHTLDFRGPGVVATNDPSDTHRKIITISGAGGTVPPQIVSTTSNTSGNVQVTTLSADLQISGLNRGVVIQVSTEQAQTITGITVGGVAATQQAVSTDVGSNIRQETWFCANPPLGAQPVVVTLSGAAYLTFGAECVNGLDPTSPVGATQTATGTDLNPTLVIVSTVDYSIMIDGLATAQTPILYTPGAGQAANWSEIANTSTRQGGSSVESAGLQPDPITMDYAITQNTTWCYTAIELVGITSGGTGGGHIIEDNTVPLPQQPALNFEDFFTLSNNPGNSSTDVNLDLVAIANSTTFINALTSNVNFQNAVTAFVSGSGQIQIDQTPDNGTYGLLAGAVDGINTTYTVSLGSYPSGKLQVYLNGLIQLQGVSDDWQETTPGSGTFDFNTPPLTNDVITVVYQGSGGTASQTGIQFENEGVNLGSPGTADEVDFIGAGVTASRVGNKISVVIPGGGGGALGSTQYLAIGKAQITGGTSVYAGDRYNQDNQSGSSIGGGHIVIEASTNRIYVALNSAPNHAPNNQGTELRIFKNDFGSYYLENEISLTTPNTGGQNNITARWTTNGTNIFCVYFYSRSSDYGAPYPGGIGITKFDLDGSNPVDVQILTIPTVAVAHDSTAWDNSLPGTDQMAIGMIGNSIFMTYHTAAGAAEFREYDVSAFPTVTLANTYTVAVPDSGTAFNFDSSTSEWLLSGNDNSVVKYTISGSTFVRGIDKTYSEFDYGSPLTSTRPNPSQIATITPGASSNTIYVVNGEGFNYFTSSHQNYYFNFLLSSVEFPKF